MALDVFSSVLTAKQIVTLAERLCNNPGLHLTPSGIEPDGTPGNTMVDAPAYATLQIILDQLALTQTFTFTRAALDVTIASRHNDLPQNFWRVGFADPTFIYSSTPDVYDRRQFYLLDAQTFHRRFQDGQVGRPEVGYINRANGVLTVDPAPDQVYTIELHYYPWQPELASTTSIPWFPSSKYLLNDLLCTLYLHDSDQRYAIADKERKELMKQVKSSMGDSTDRASLQVELDPLCYHQPMEL